MRRPCGRATAGPFKGRKFAMDKLCGQQTGEGTLGPTYPTDNPEILSASRRPVNIGKSCTTIGATARRVGDHNKKTLGNLRGFSVSRVGLEPTTSCLKGTCSAIELAARTLRLYHAHGAMSNIQPAKFNLKHSGPRR